MHGQDGIGTGWKNNVKKLKKKMYLRMHCPRLSYVIKYTFLRKQNCKKNNAKVAKVGGRN